MATARLRKTFAYPTEEISAPADLDETEQETLITSLATHDASSTSFYTYIFTALPLLIAVPYLLRVFTTGSSSSTLALLSLTSLLASAFTQLYIPLEPTSATPTLARQLQVARGALERYLPALNGGLAGLLSVGGFVRARRLGDGEEGVFAVLPLAMFAITMVVRTQLRPVDVDSLTRMKYGYKGA